ncbi:hypothetical protein Tco_0258263, partial [Tanacetum coccineum]
MHVIEQPLPPAPEAGAMNLTLWLSGQLYMMLILKLLELRSMFEKQARVEKFDLIQSFHACKRCVLKMKGYVEKLERLGYVLPQDITVGLIL